MNRKKFGPSIILLLASRPTEEVIKRYSRDFADISLLGIPDDDEYGCHVYFRDVNNRQYSSWLRELGRIEVGGLVNYSLRIEDYQSHEDYPSEEWLGLTLHPERADLLCDNPVEDFVPPYCRLRSGLLKDNIPIRIQERLCGRVVNHGWNPIYETRFLEILGGEQVGDRIGEVWVDGFPVKDWVRFRPRERCDLIWDDCFEPPMPCRNCGLPERLFCGLYIAKSDAELATDVALESTGHGCGGHARSVVISPRTAYRLNQAFRGVGYRLQPIFRWDSPTVQRILEILALARQLKPSPLYPKYPKDFKAI